jgi:hypothetical protein
MTLNIQANETKRVNGLNDKAINSASSAKTDLMNAAAAGVFYLMCGHPHFLNDLYTRLVKANSGMAGELRSVFTAKVHDHFGLGGVRDENDASKWKIRPTAFFVFGTKVNNGGAGFALVSVKNNLNLNEKQVKEIKAARAAIREAGEETLRADKFWTTPDDEIRNASFNPVTNARSFLLKQAKFAYSKGGLTKDQILSIGKMFDLPSDDLTKIVTAYQATKPVADNDADDEFDNLPETAIAKFEVIKGGKERPSIADKTKAA